MLRNFIYNVDGCVKATDNIWMRSVAGLQFGTVGSAACMMFRTISIISIAGHVAKGY